MGCLISPSKVNIGLAITGRRADGYHRLESLFWPIQFGDVIEIETASESSVTATWSTDAPFPNLLLPQGEKNLAFKALEAALREKQLGYRITLHKKVPLGGGLGGGSSNAGTILKFLVEDGKLSSGDAEQIAPRLGADVPFFLNPVPSWVTGIGEIRQRLCIAPGLSSSLVFLLILLPCPIDTSNVFSTYASMGTEFSSSLAINWHETLTWKGFQSYLAEARNDLQTAAQHANPLIGKVLSRLREIESEFTGLSGSGASCFSIFRSLTQADCAAKDLSGFLRKHHCKSIIAESYLDAS